MGGLCALTLMVGCGDDGATSTGSTTEVGTTGTTGPIAVDTTGTPTTGDEPTGGTDGTGSGSGEPPDESSSSTGEPVTDTSTGDPESTSGSSSGSGSESSTGAPLDCGDGIVNGDEECDDANRVDTDDCTNVCALATCGDQVVQAGVEQCDDGQASEACDADCSLAECGDGETNEAAGEACDDGNALDNDACVEGCQPAQCGDGFIQVGVELCDDGNMVDGDACTNACEPGVGALRPDVMVCGSIDDEISDYFPVGTDFNVISSCSPNAKTQAMFVTRKLGFIDGVALKAYLAAGGIVLTEYSISDDVFGLAFEFVNQGQNAGSCQDTAPTVVQFTPGDPLWASVPFQAITQAQSGCGYGVGAFPGVTPLAGWNANNVAIAYRDLGLGRLYLTDFDWQDGEVLQDMTYTETLMGYMMTHAK